MKATVTMELTRESLVSMLAAYSKSACPSAMAKILAEALLQASQELGDSREKDATWLAAVSESMRGESECLRIDEDGIYLQDLQPMRRTYVYYTVVIPPVSADVASKWHCAAGMVVTAGAFSTAYLAHKWAEAHIAGHEYSVRACTGVAVDE